MAHQQLALAVRYLHVAAMAAACQVIRARSVRCIPAPPIGTTGASMRAAMPDQRSRCGARSGSAAAPASIVFRSASSIRQRAQAAA